MAKMNVCLVDPQGLFRGLNVGLGYLASVLHEDGISAKVFDFNGNRRHLSERIKEISKFDLVGFSIKSFTIDSALDILSRVKEESGKGKIHAIAGGPHTSLFGSTFLEQNDFFDIGVIGEAEEIIKDIVKFFLNQNDLKDINGIIYRFGNKVYVNPPRPPITNLDSLPFPKYDAFDSIGPIIETYPIITSRGCPFSCIFCCAHKVMGKKWRARSPKNVVSELAHAKKRYNIKVFDVWDDNFTLDMRRAKQICQLITDEKLGLQWECTNGLRADRLDKELLQLMKRAGCRRISIGIESLNPKEFESIKKGERLETVITAIKTAQKVGIKVYGSFIIGLPFSTIESVRESIKLANRLKLEYCIWNLLVPYPGTEVYEWSSKNGEMLRDWKDCFAIGPEPKVAFDTEEFPETNRLTAYYEANIKCGNYMAFATSENSVLSTAWTIFRMIARYDKRNAFSHIMRMWRKRNEVSNRLRLHSKDTL